MVKCIPDGGNTCKGPVVEGPGADKRPTRLELRVEDGEVEQGQPEQLLKWVVVTPEQRGASDGFYVGRDGRSDTRRLAWLPCWEPVGGQPRSGREICRRPWCGYERGQQTSGTGLQGNSQVGERFEFLEMDYLGRREARWGPRMSSGLWPPSPRRAWL